MRAPYFHAGMWTSLILCSSCIGTQKRQCFQKAKMPWVLEYNRLVTSRKHRHSLILTLITIHPLLLPKLWKWEDNVMYRQECPVYEWALYRCSFSALWPAVRLCFNYCPTRRKSFSDEDWKLHKSVGNKVKYIFKTQFDAMSIQHHNSRRFTP